MQEFSVVALLHQVGVWRERLVRNLAPRDRNGSSGEVNSAAQRTIVCAVFLRMAEERGLETCEQLRKLSERPHAYRRFVQLCRAASDKYDSDLLRLTCDGKRAVDDDVFSSILSDLYDEHENACRFEELPSEALGEVYERLLEREIGSRAKSSRKKAGGVYYTPSYIVEYIVRQTVGRQLADSKGIAPLRVLDMACGGGAFLLGAYRFLLDYYLNWYVAHRPERYRRAVERDPHDGRWRLTIEERKRLLTAHLFGVDVDPQAVEITKLSLLLEALDRTDAAPPSLAENIRCGNALIGPDLHADRSSFDAAESERLNSFDWHRAFPVPMNAGGFDCVIGNPPYVNARALLQTQGQAVKRYFRERYASARGAYDLYVLFLEKSLELLRNDAHGGVIVPNKIATLEYATACRRLLLEHASLENIVDVSSLDAFPSAGVYPYIITWRKSPADGKHRVGVMKAKKAEDLFSNDGRRTLRQSNWNAPTGFTIHGALDVEARSNTEPLARRAALHSGTTGFVAQEIAAALRERSELGKGERFPFVVSGNIDRYSLSPRGVRYMKRTFERPVLPADCRTLSEGKRELFRRPKIVIAGMTKRLEATWVEIGLALGVSVYAAVVLLDDPHYVLGLLNSKLLSYLFRLRFQAKHLAGGFLAINVGQLSQLPLRVIDPSRLDERAKHDEIVRHVRSMLDLHKQRQAAKTAARRDDVSRRIDALDAEIDHLVYELYGLTEREIAEVENGAE